MHFFPIYVIIYDGDNMEKKYDLSSYDYHNYYYFIDENGCFQVPKTIKMDEYNDLSKRYFQKTKSWLSSFLFDGGEFIKKTNLCKFIIIDTESVDPSIKTKIIELFQDLIHDADFLELKGKTVCFYYHPLDVHFKDLISTINSDFYTEIKLYESSKLNIKKPADFLTLFELYLKYTNHAREYTSNSDLIMDIVNKNPKVVKVLKPIILYKVLQDSQLIKLIEGLFANNLNITKTANDVFMHRNTINNKVDIIASETGLNMQNFYDALAMYMLLNLK